MQGYINIYTIDHEFTTRLQESPYAIGVACECKCCGPKICCKSLRRKPINKSQTWRTISHGYTYKTHFGIDRAHRAVRHCIEYVYNI